MRVHRIAGALALIVLGAACSSSSDATNTTKSSSDASGSRPNVCQRAFEAPPKVTPVEGSKSDLTMESFDGARIRMHWFPLATATSARPAPTVLMGPGWGMGGDTNVTPTGGGLGVFGANSIAGLHDHGYNVLTWDPRGFGVSTGTVTTDDPDHEGIDVQRMLDWVAAQPGVQLDGKGDPRVGMTGGSYGGGIQLATAVSDCRLDALVPWIAWNSLGTSLNKAGVAKTGWGNLLFGIASSRDLDPHIRSAFTASNATGVVSAADAAWFRSRGLGARIDAIKVPTLFVQGTVDTLFTLDEAVTNYRSLRKRGVPTAMLWYCGGHGTCLTPAGDANAASKSTLAWLDHYLQGKSGSLGPRFTMVDQRGTTYTAPDYPADSASPITASAEGTLQLVPTGGSGPSTATPASKDVLSGVVSGITPARATNALNVPIDTTKAVVIAGSPELQLDYTGTVAAGDRPTAVFAQVVDNATGLVVGNQVTPVPLVLDGKPHSVTVPLEAIAFTLEPGNAITLQVVATTVAYAAPRLDGSVQLAARVRVPVSTITPR